MANYFRDCIDEVGLELEARGVELDISIMWMRTYTSSPMLKQMKRVINNIIGNSLKYMDKKKGIIEYPDLGCG